MELMVDYITSLDGYGRERIYDGYPDVAVDLIGARTFDRDTRLLDYRPRLLAAPLPPGPGSA